MQYNKFMFEYIRMKVLFSADFWPFYPCYTQQVMLVRKRLEENDSSDCFCSNHDLPSSSTFVDTYIGKATEDEPEAEAIWTSIEFTSIN